MSRPFCIHIGVPKTATTTLQMALFSAHPEIRYFGKPYWDEAAGWEQSHAMAQLVDMIWQKDTLQFDSHLAQHFYNTGIVPRLDDSLQPVLSEEALSQASGADRFLIAERLRSLFGSDCKILITIRNQISALKSGYLWCKARRILNCSFDSWITECLSKSVYRQCIDDWPLRQYRYDELVHVYQHIFGAQNITVLMYEDLVRSPESFIQKLSQMLNVKHTDFIDNYYYQRAVFNPSLSESAIAYQRTAKLLKAQAPMLFGKDFTRDALLEGGIHDKAMHLLGRCKKAHTAISESSAQILHDYFVSSNNRLVEMCSLPLKEHGYPL